MEISKLERADEGTGLSTTTSLNGTNDGKKRMPGK